MKIYNIVLILLFNKNTSPISFYFSFVFLILVRYPDFKYLYYFSLFWNFSLNQFFSYSLIKLETFFFILVRGMFYRKINAISGKLTSHYKYTVNLYFYPTFFYHKIIYLHISYNKKTYD